MSSSLLPAETVGTVDVIPVTGGRFSQVCYQPTLRRIMVRTYNGTSWSDWSRLDAFGCATPEALASLLGGITKNIPSGGNLNDLTEQGVIYVSGSGATSQTLLNRPIDLAQACILKAPTSRLQFIITTWAAFKLYKRSYDNGWGKWQLVTGTEVEYA